VAVQAVLRELVSKPNSLFAGKKQGISAKIGVFARLMSRKRAVFQCITGEIPYGQEQGIFSIRAGNIRERSGIWVVGPAAQKKFSLSYGGQEATGAQ
jgi:hypothetical protein